MCLPLKSTVFFSPEVDRFREAVISIEPFKAWFDYARGLSRIGLGLLKRATTPWQMTTAYDVRPLCPRSSDLSG
jgi:hypothetical protein